MSFTAPDVSMQALTPLMAGLSKRQRQIVERVRNQGFVTIETLAEEFDTSAQTVRRDIIRLSEIGLLQRFHGGAGLADTTALPVRAAREDTAAADKGRVAAGVARLIPNNSTVFLDAGSTALAVGEALLGHQGLRVITSSLPAAMSMGRGGPLAVQVTGGELRDGDGALVGSGALAMLGDIRVDVAVIGCSGFDKDGSPMGFDAEKVAVKRAAMRVADLAILATDASKFERPALMRISPGSSFGALVCSAPPPPRMADALTAAAVRIVVV